MMPDRLLFTLSKIQNKLTAYLKQELKKEGLQLTPGQMGVLLVLKRMGQTTMGDLSRALESDNAVITRLVDRLEKNGLVRRDINPEDRRQMLIFITETGVQAAVVVKRIGVQANSKIKAGFSQAEIDIYIQVTSAMLDKF